MRKIKRKREKKEEEVLSFDDEFDEMKSDDEQGLFDPKSQQVEPEPVMKMDEISDKKKTPANVRTDLDEKPRAYRS